MGDIDTWIILKRLLSQTRRMNTQKIILLRRKNQILRKKGENFQDPQKEEKERYRIIMKMTKVMKIVTTGTEVGNLDIFEFISPKT